MTDKPILFSGPWIDGEKLDDCPKCGKNLNQKEYDMQHCGACAPHTVLKG